MSWVNSWKRGAASPWARVRAQVQENLNGLVFAVGLALLLVGVRAWSPAAAYVVAGAIVMAVAAVPYLMKLLNTKGPR